jgi:uncharacterized protein YodC (DUF2158 family)
MMIQRSSAVNLAAVGLCILMSGWITPVVADTRTPTTTARVAKVGDLVRLKSGGPLMIVESVQGNRVTGRWATAFGEVRTGEFRIGDLSAPVAVPPADPNEKRDEALADRYYRHHCPSGFLTFSGKFRCAY